MAGLADDWEENRQTCIDVLCAYLRMPYRPDPGKDAPLTERLAFQAGHEVRHTVIRVITAHLNGNAAKSWRGLNFDFTGAVFDGADFTDAQFSGGQVSFAGAQFSGREVSFASAGFSGGEVDFAGAVFSAKQVYFQEAVFSAGPVFFYLAQFSAEEVSFYLAEFSGGEVSFPGAEFLAGEVSFDSAKFSAGKVSFFHVQFSGGKVSFPGAEFSGGKVSFAEALFSGGEVDFSQTANWSHPPAFGTGFDESSPPPGVKLPAAAGPPRLNWQPVAFRCDEFAEAPDPPCALPVSCSAEDAF